MSLYKTFQVLDPIDGTRGFVKGSEALYVVSSTPLVLCIIVEDYHASYIRIEKCENFAQMQFKMIFMVCVNMRGRSGLLIGWDLLRILSWLGWLMYEKNHQLFIFVFRGPSYQWHNLSFGLGYLREGHYV